MKKLKSFHPLTIFIYYVFLLGILMFEMNPFFVCIAFLGAISMGLKIDINLKKRDFVFYIVFFIVASCINPIFYHNGSTVLFYISGKRITLEALIYGIITSSMLLTVLITCREMSLILSSDKVLYLLGKVSLKASLIVSMTLRFIPLFRRQAGKIRESQKMLGLYRDNTFFDKVKAEITVFSATTSWALEHSVETSDSIRGRGYGITRRTHYSIFKIKITDVVLMAVMIILMSYILYAVSTGSLRIIYYPNVVLPKTGLVNIIAYVSYALMVFIFPMMVNADE